MAADSPQDAIHHVEAGQVGESTEELKLDDLVEEEYGSGGSDVGKGEEEDGDEDLDDDDHGTPGSDVFTVALPGYLGVSAPYRAPARRQTISAADLADGRIWARRGPQRGIDQLGRALKFTPPMLQRSSDFTTWKHLFLSFINTSVPEVMEQMILLDPNDPNIDPQLQSYLYHTLVQIAQHHPSATSELKNLSQSTAVNRGAIAWDNMCHRLDRQDVHHTMSLLDEVNRTLDKNSTESLVDFLDRKWEAIQAYDAAMERAKIKALKIKYPGDSQTKASTGAALAAFEDDNTAAVTDQPSDDTDAGDELTLEEEEMLLNYASYPPDPSGESNMQQTVALLSAAGIPTPRNFKEAMSPEFRDLWKPAIHKEYEGLMANRTWELVDCPPGATILPNQWVFVAKAAPDGTLDKAKARAVVCGNYQKDGDTCKETYAPVIRISSLRVFFTIVAAMQLHLRQLDAVAAYLNASIPADEYLYMRQLQGFDDGSGRVCRLLKCLYGLRQSGRYWCKLLAMWLISVGWIQCKADPCIFILRQGEIYAAMGVYVDDMELAGNDDTWLDSFETDLRNRFVVKRQHDPWVIGMSVSYDRPNRRITLTQTAYIKEILERFGMLDCKKSDVPMVADFCKQPLTSVSESPLLDADGRSQYVRLMGCLLYVSTCTRPDITTALSILGSVQKEPRVMHMTALKKVLRYLKGTMHRGITLGADSTDNLRLVGYADADFAADLIQRRSRGGYLFRLGDHGACSYKSALMPTATQETGGGIAQSTVDAETVSLAQAIKDGIHLKMLVSEILGSPVQPLIMMEDNQGAISYATNAVISDRTKHIDVKWHFVKDHVEAGTVGVNYIATDLNTADMMTKPLPRPALEKHARFAMGW
eukprot:jgi/Tetstr1/444080/TSEL_003319.t2